MMGYLPEIPGWSCSTNRPSDDEQARGGGTATGLSAAGSNALQLAITIVTLLNFSVRYLILGALLLTACRTSGPAGSTALATPSAAVPTIDPATQTASPQPAPSETPTGVATPTQTPAARATPTVAPPCFVSDFYPVGFIPDGTRVVFWAATSVKVFNLQTMQFEMVLESPTPLTISAVALAPDGNTLAWALADNTIQLIRLSDKKLLHTLVGHTDVIGKLRFSPHGDRLYSASHDSWVRIWDLNGNSVGAFQPQEVLTRTVCWA